MKHDYEKRLYKIVEIENRFSRKIDFENRALFHFRVVRFRVIVSE
jgi:hypothetical protein